MPIHDWTKVSAAIFHHFHHAWISSISDALNDGLLPSEYYALIEQTAGGLVADEPEAQSEADQYARKAKSVVVRHASDHRIIAMVEIVSPGNKASRLALRQFVEKAQDLLTRGVHLLIVDLFPPGSLDPDGIHKAIWDYADDTFAAHPTARSPSPPTWAAAPPKPSSSPPPSGCP